MSTLKGTTMHPRCRHIGETYLNVDLSSSAQVKISQIQFRTFLKKISNFWFPCCSTCEDLSVDVSITYLGLVLAKPGRFLFSAYGNSGYGQNSISSISNFLKKFTFSGFHGVVLAREDHSIDASITDVGLILTKLRWSQLFVKNQNSNFFEKKNEFLGFHGVVLVKTFPLMYQLLMYDWYWRSYGDFSSSSKVKIRISNFFEKKKSNLWVSMV